MKNPQADKVVRRVTMVATITASYFLLTADYGPEPNVLDPLRGLKTLQPLPQWQESLSGRFVEFKKDKFSIVSDTAPIWVKKGILTAESTVKEYIFGSKKESQDNQTGKLDSNKDHP